MSKEQEDLFKEFQNIKSKINYCAGFVQNDFKRLLEDNHIDIDAIRAGKQDQKDSIDEAINALKNIKEKCINYFDSVLPIEPLTGEQINNLLFAYYFSKFYSISREPHPDEEFVLSHQFYVMVTPETTKNGYASDSKHVLLTLKLNTKYALKSMNVGMSSSSLELVEFPKINFNPVNFIFLPEYDYIHQPGGDVTIM